MPRRPDPRREEQIDDAIAFWEPRMGRPISPEEAREIIDNVSALFKILLEWNAVDLQEKARKHRRREAAPVLCKAA